MFHKFHIQMTLFASGIISLILIVLTAACLLISENSIRQNTKASFLNERSTILTHLQSQNTISLQWINQIQENNHFLLFFYDNGVPLYVQRLYADENEHLLADTVLEYAYENYQLDLSHTYSSTLPVYQDFAVTDKENGSYYASAGVLSKSGNALGFLILYPLSYQQQQISLQRLLFAASDAAALLLLTAFIWFFTGRLLLPLKENHQKQIQFTASASHELRAPLAVMLSGTEALEKAENAAERKHFIHMMQSEGLRMQHLISDLLLLSHSDSNTLSIRPVSCQPDLLLLDAYEKYEIPARKKKLSLLLHLPEQQLPSCLADPERIAQIFSILLDNAISYTPEGGTVILSLSAASFTVRRSKFDTILFQISDNGPSIPDTEKELIFERFYRAEASHTNKQHFGLGLCIAKEIALAHHGQLWVEDVTGGGACFTLALPPADQ